MIYSKASRHLTEALLLPAAMLVMSHRSISYRGITDIATPHSRYCGQ